MITKEMKIKRAFYITILSLFIITLCVNIYIFIKASRYTNIYDSISIGMDVTEVEYLLNTNLEEEFSTEDTTYIYYVSLGFNTDFTDFIKIHFKEGTVVGKEAFIFNDSSFFDKGLKERFFSTPYFFKSIKDISLLLLMATILFFLINIFYKKYVSEKGHLRIFWFSLMIIFIAVLFFVFLYLIPYMLSVFLDLIDILFSIVLSRL